MEELENKEVIMPRSSADFSGETPRYPMDGNSNCTTWCRWETYRAFRNGQPGWDCRFIINATKTNPYPTYGQGKVQAGVKEHEEGTLDEKYIEIVAGETRTFYDQAVFVKAEAGADVPLNAYANILVPNVVSKGMNFTISVKRNLWYVTYNANGGSYAPSTQKKHFNNTLYLSTQKPTRSGYTFKGWSTSSSSSYAQYQPGDAFTADADTTLYAVWEEEIETYTITYDANGGSPTPSSQTKKHGVSINITKVVPKKERYIFIGWSTVRNGSVQYNSGDTYSTNANLNLYAVWEYDTRPIYTIKFYANAKGISTSVSNMPETMTFREGETCTLAKEPYRNGYNFKGWSLGQYDFVAKYNTGSSFKVTKSENLYAIWDFWGDGSEFEIRYIPDGTVANMPEYQYVTRYSYTYLSSKIPVKEGYDFVGWSSYGFGSRANYQPATGYTFNENLKLYSIFELKKYTVTYDGNGEVVLNVPSSQTEYVTSNITLSKLIPIRNGYKFLGWSKTKTATTATYRPGDLYTYKTSTTLYAVWKEKGKPKFTFSESYYCTPYSIGAVEELVMSAIVENPENQKIYYKICFVDDADGTVNDYVANSDGSTSMIETGITSAALTVQPDILIRSIKNCNNEKSFKIVICSNYDNNFELSNTTINKQIISIKLYYNKPIVQSLEVSHAPYNGAQLVGVVKFSDNFISIASSGNGESVYTDNKPMELGGDYSIDNRFDVDGENTLRYVFNFNVNKISDANHTFKLVIDDGFFKTEQTVNLGRLSSDENIYIYQDGTIEANGFLLLDSFKYDNEDVILFEPGGFVSAKSFEKISDGICFCPKVLEAFGHTQRTGD